MLAYGKRGLAVRHAAEADIGRGRIRGEVLPVDRPCEEGRIVPGAAAHNFSRAIQRAGAG